ncbi:hypothetical protein pb186bvf_000706 [Paramecium bursaria]
MINKFRFSTIYKYVLPQLKYDYGELSPVISPTLLEFHHSKHHQAYVNNLNVATEQIHEAIAKNDTAKVAALQKNLNFNLGGHLNHSLFWEILAPKNKDGGVPLSDKSQLYQEITKIWGSYDAFINHFNTRTAAIQGSGWGFLGVDNQSKTLRYIEVPNQDLPQSQGITPILTIDVWEHAYWWDYKNVRPHYLTNIWQVVNWTAVEAKYKAAL